MQRKEGKADGGTVACYLNFQQRGCSHMTPFSCRELMKKRNNVVFCYSINFQHRGCLIPFFHFFPKPSQVSSNLYQQLTPLFQFFSIQSCKLGEGGNPSCGRKCLRQNFHFLIRYSNRQKITDERFIDETSLLLISLVN